MPEISVLLPVFNVEAYVAEALASIQSQTFADIEIVVVDDGSTDGTLRVVEQITSADARIKLVRMPRNLGLPSALNLGLAYCQSRFVARMDGDDIALPSRLEKQLEFLEANPDIALAGCAFASIDMLGNPIRGLGIEPRVITQEEIARTLLFASPCIHPGWMARKEIYSALLGYREIPYAEDYDFLLRAVTSGYRISNLPDVLMKLRSRPGQISPRLEQTKAHFYVAGLYRERMRRGADSFSRDSVKRAIETRKVEAAVYRVGMRLNQRGIQSGNRILKFFLAGLSALASPWQARYFLGRIRIKRVHQEALNAL